MVVSRQLLEKYTNASYHVHSSGEDYPFRIGGSNTALQGLLGRFGAGTACLITACNPYSRPFPDEVNREANDHLREELTRRGLTFLTGEGSDPDGEWPAEESFLVFDLPQEMVADLCRRYRQNAVVWIGDNGIAELLIPAGAKSSDPWSTGD